MELSTATPLSKALFSLAMGFMSDPATPLNPPTPYYELAPYESYLNDLEYTDIQLGLIKSATKDQWKKFIFIRTKDDTPLFNDQYLKGWGFNYLFSRLANAETSVYQYLKTIWDGIDEVNQVSLTQIKNTGCNIAGTAKEFIAKHMMEGTYLGYIDHGFFKKGREFSYQQMMRNNATANALVSLSFEDMSFVKAKNEDIKFLVLDHLNKQNRWHYRWRMCEKVSDLEYILKGQSDIYTQIKNEVYQENISWKFFYDLKAKTLELRETLFYLKLTFFEHMLKTKPKEEWEKNFEKLLNQGVRGINSQLEIIEEAPLFEDVLIKANKLTKDSYDHLFPLTKKKGEFGAVLNTYVDAIKKDLFTEAKWISLRSDTTSEGPPFNWAQEAGHFENYKRKIDLIFKTKNHLDEIIEELTNVSIQICNEPPEDLLRYKYLCEQNNNIIYSCWKQRDELDNLRIKLRQGFLKDIKTRVNESKEYLERFIQSAQNKGLRFLLDGDPLDKTELYNDVNSQIITSYKNYRDLLKTIKLNLPNHKVNLAPILNTQDDYPVFYDKDDYVSFTQTNEINTSTLNIIKYNLERICDFSDSSYFKKNLIELQKVLEIYKQITLLKKSAKNLESYTQTKVELNEDFLYKTNISFLGACFKKFVISEKNRQSPVDTFRITTSATNKISRITKTGSVFDDTKEFPDIYPALHTQIVKTMKIIHQETEELLKTSPILRLKTTTVFFDDGKKKIKLTFFPEKNQTVREKKPKEKVTIKIDSLIEDYHPNIK